MGISKFHGWYMRRRSGLWNGKSYSAEPRDVSYVFIDMNSVLHKVAQKRFGYGEYEDQVELPRPNRDIQKIL